MGIRVYVAGPISQGDTLVNIRRGIEAGQELWRLGYVPYIPHLDALWHLFYPKGYDGWIPYDLEWLKLCQAVVRLPGESWGADTEEDAARQLGIPVYHSVQELVTVMGVSFGPRNGVERDG